MSLRRGDQSWVTVLPRSDGKAEPDFLCTRGADVCERLLAILVHHPGADKHQCRIRHDGDVGSSFKQHPVSSRIQGMPLRVESVERCVHHLIL